MTTATVGASWRQDVAGIGAAAAGLTALILAHPSGGTVRVSGAMVTRLQSADDYPGRYVIGGECASELVPATATARRIYASAVAILARTPGDAVGWWQAQGVIFLDAVTFSDSRDAALELARARGELAVWDTLLARELDAVAS